MKKIVKMFVWYFALVGVGLHFVAIATYILKPKLSNKAIYMVMDKVTKKFPDVFAKNHIKPSSSIKAEIQEQFGIWQPNNQSSTPANQVIVGNKTFSSLKKASLNLQDGDTVIIGEGIYHEPLVIKNNFITIQGNGHVIIENTSAEGKGAIITKGDFTKIYNIECRRINVSDQNGACVRHEGKHLELKHVYFHDSQTGLLTGKKPGLITIEDSRFENLGKNGQAHGIYTNGGELFIKNSLFIAAKSEGHEIKSRSSKTIIRSSVIASLSSTDSRLIDVSQGGILKISNSVLQQGPLSANGDMIGFGLESMPYPVNSITLSGNTIILERNGHNVLLHKKQKATQVISKNNLIIAKENIQLPGFNIFYSSRKDANFKPYPFIPKP